MIKSFKLKKSLNFSFSNFRKYANVEVTLLKPVEINVLEKYFSGELNAIKKPHFSTLTGSRVMQFAFAAVALEYVSFAAFQSE